MRFEHIYKCIYSYILTALFSLSRASTFLLFLITSYTKWSTILTWFLKVSSEPMRRNLLNFQSGSTKRQNTQAFAVSNAFMKRVVLSHDPSKQFNSTPIPTFDIVSNVSLINNSCVIYTYKVNLGSLLGKNRSIYYFLSTLTLTFHIYSFLIHKHK